MCFAAPWRSRLAAVKFKRYSENICSYYGEWQPDSPTERMKNRKVDRETKERKWQREQQVNKVTGGGNRGNSWHMKHLRKTKTQYCCAVHFIYRLNLSTEHEPTSFPLTAKTALWECDDSVVCLQASRLKIMSTILLSWEREAKFQ